MSTISLRINNKVAYLTINRAEKRNALTQAMWGEISDVCDRLVDDIKPRVLVLTGAGDKAFSAGADIEELTHIITDSERQIANNRQVQAAQIKLQNLPFATVAAINGVCVGGGMGLALACDFRIAVSHARFGITPSRLGLLYSIEDTQRVVDLVGLARAKELLYLGKIIDSDTALQWGMLNSLVSAEQLQSEIDTWVNQLLQVSGYSITGVKQTLAHISRADSSNETQIRALFEQAFSQADFKEGADAFLQKRAPVFD